MAVVLPHAPSSDMCLGILTTVTPVALSVGLLDALVVSEPAAIPDSFTLGVASTIGALTISYTILRVPYYNYSIVGPKILLLII